MHRTANILAVGDELILGQSLDTNSQQIAEKLTASGVRVVQHATVDDELEVLTAAIKRLALGIDLLIITGGLGPTADDMTRQALAHAAGQELVKDEEAMRVLEGWFSGRSMPMPETNRVQAFRPEYAKILRNDHGTAPGLWCRIDECDVFAMPGPPHEMIPMLRRELESRLRTDPGHVIKTRQLQTFGLGESRVAELLGELMDRERDPLIGTTASGGVVSVRLRSERAGSEVLAEKALDADEALIREKLGVSVFHVGPEKDALVRTVNGLLSGLTQTLGTIESCTGGGLGTLVTSVEGSSEVFAGGLVTYTNELKTILAGVDRGILDEHHAVSSQVAIAMAEGGRARLGCDHTLAITGVAGPGGGSEEKPVGTVWIAAAGGGVEAEARRFVFSGDRSQVRHRSSMAALGMLRLRLLGESMVLLWEAERVTASTP